jgi:hypothetical protein
MGAAESTQVRPSLKAGPATTSFLVPLPLFKSVLATSSSASHPRISLAISSHEAVDSQHPILTRSCRLALQKKQPLGRKSSSGSVKYIPPSVQADKYLDEFTVYNKERVSRTRCVCVCAFSVCGPRTTASMQSESPTELKSLQLADSSVVCSVLPLTDPLSPASSCAGVHRERALVRRRSSW